MKVRGVTYRVYMLYACMVWMGVEVVGYNAVFLSIWCWCIQYDIISRDHILFLCSYDVNKNLHFLLQVMAKLTEMRYVDVLLFSSSGSGLLLLFLMLISLMMTLTLMLYTYYSGEIRLSSILN